MPKESTIQHYTSSTTGSTPTSGNLASGELAINTADEKIFYKNHVGTVLSLSETKDLSGAFAASSKVVSSFNGLTGNVSLTGDGDAIQGKSNNTITARLATDSLTGVASFNSSHFSVSNGAVSLASAYQVTGDTVVAGSNVAIVRSGNTVTINSNEGIGSDTLTGVASFDPRFFGIGSTGHLVLASAYQVTGDTVVAGSNVAVVRSGNTVTINANEGLGSYTLTGVASFDPRFFEIGSTGHLVLAGAYQVTGDTVQAGSFINIGAGKTINNIGVHTINGATGAITNVAKTNVDNNFSDPQTFTDHIKINDMYIGQGNPASLYNVVIGASASSQTSTGVFNIAIGFMAMSDQTSSINNVAIGARALENSIFTSGNVAIGAQALQTDQYGSNNLAIGYEALKLALDTQQNTAVGSSALKNTNTGYRNTAIGFRGLENNTTGVANVAIGYEAGKYRGAFTSFDSPNDLNNEEVSALTRTTGTGGIYIGQWSRASANGQINEIVVGAGALGLGSNTAVIGATAQVSATIYGTLNLPGGLSAAGATFSGLAQFTAGISAAGGVTLAGSLQGSTASFSGLAQFSAGISASGGITFAGIVSSDTGYRISPSAINTQTGTTYSLSSNDNGEVITFNNGSAVTVTIPSGLPVGFNCTAIQLGAGQVGFTADAGVTLNSYGGLSKLAGQHGAATIIAYTTNVFNIAGTLST